MKKANKREWKGCARATPAALTELANLPIAAAAATAETAAQLASEARRFDPGLVPSGVTASRRREQHLAGVIASIMDAIIAIDERQEIVLANPAAERLFGYREAQLLGKPLALLIPERFRAAHAGHIRSFADGGVSRRGMGRFGEITALRSDGSEFRVDTSIAQTESEGQRLFTVMLRDVTRRIEAEQALRKNYELLDRIFATTHFCIVYLDRDFNFVRVNQAYADACGHAPAFFVGKNHFALYPGEKVEAIFRNTVATGEPFTTYANPFEFPDHPEWGVTYWDWTLHPVKDEAGGVEGLLFALLDVTPRKRAEQELRENESSLRAAVKSVDIALFRQDRNLRYRWMYSPQLGYAPKDVIGRSDAELLPAADVPPIVALKRRVIESGVVARAEVAVVTPGARRYFDLVLEPWLDATGKLVGVTGASIDISVRKRAEEELRYTTALALLLESLARATSEAAAPEQAMRTCLTRLCEFGNWTLGHVAMTGQMSGDFRIPGESIWHATDLAHYENFVRAWQDIPVLLDTGQFITIVVREKRPVWIPDIGEAHGFGRRTAALGAGLHAAFAFPVIVQGEVVAFLEFFADAARPADPVLVGAAETIAAQVALLIVRGRGERIRARLADIVEHSDDAIISCGLDRKILTWNAAAERLFGYTAAEAIGCDAHEFVPPEERALAGLRYALLTDGVRVPSYEGVRIGAGGRRIDVACTLSPIPDAAGGLSGVSLIFRDIGERKRGERDRARLAAIIESSNDAILLRGLDRTILSWNAAAERLFGWKAIEAVGQPIDLIIPPERGGMPRRYIERSARGEFAGPVESVHVRKDGTRLPTQVTFSPVFDEKGKVIAHSYTVRDMSEIKKKEEALRTLARRLHRLSRRLREMEEAERCAIARELHDRIGQDLSTLGLLVGSLAAKLAPGARRKVEKPLLDMQNLIRSTVENVRDVMAGLRPPLLDDYGLLAALRQLASEFSERSGIAVQVSGVDLQPRLPSVLETAMYRISQEALNNVAKHARANSVQISLETAPDRIMLYVVDNGIGFDARAMPRDKRHWGLSTMRERAEAVGIAFRLKSAPGEGTRIALEAERVAS